jgi:hypothetical protein
MTHRKPACSLFAYEASQLITIDGVNQYHAVIGLSEGSCNGGVTYTASATGSITDTEDNSGTLRCTDVGHGLTTGQYVTLTGMGDAAHAGITAVTVISVDVFDCDDIAYNSIDDTGTWSRGSSMTVNTGRGGMYLLTYSSSLLSAGINKNYRFELYKNTSPLDEFASERKIAVASDLGVIGASGLRILTGGDVVWMATKCTTDDSNLTIEHANVHIVRL